MQIDRLLELHHASRVDQIGAALNAMERLPEEQHLAVALVLIEGLPYKEAAQIIGVPMGTLTSRLARGREALQELLEPGDIE